MTSDRPPADPSPTTPALAWPTWLVAQRDQRGWTQAALADKVSCSPRTIGNRIEALRAHARAHDAKSSHGR